MKEMFIFRTHVLKTYFLSPDSRLNFKSLSVNPHQVPNEIYPLKCHRAYSTIE